MSHPTPVTHQPRGCSAPLRSLRRSGVVAAVTAVALAIPTSGAAAATHNAGSLHFSAATAAVASATTGPALTQFSDSLTSAQYETRLKHRMNVVRKRHGLRGLGVRSCVDGFAEDWTRWLVANKAFEHQDLGPMMRTCSLSSAAEILAMGPVSPRRMVQMWMDSPGHRQIMLSRAYSFTGISATKALTGSWTGAIEFGRH